MEELIEKYIQRVESSLDVASDVINTPELLRTQLNDFLLDEIPGKSSKEMRIFFNELVKDDDEYLQIGGLSFGHTFISALFENNVKYAVGIDHYGGPLFASDTYDKLLAVSYYSGIEIDEKVFIIRDEYFKLKEESKKLIHGRKFNVIYYCGETGLEHNIKKFTEYYDYFDDVFIFVTAGARFENVMTGTKIGIEKANLTLIKDWFLEPENDHKRSDKLSWYNGLYVSILKK